MKKENTKKKQGKSLTHDNDNNHQLNAKAATKKRTMSSSTVKKTPYEKNEKAFCFHGEMLYEVKILDIRQTIPEDDSSPVEYYVHYKGWKNTWDDWILEDRLRKFSDDNRKLAHTIRKGILQSQAEEAKDKNATSGGVDTNSKKKGGAADKAPSDVGGLHRGSEDSRAEFSRRRYEREVNVEVSHVAIRIPLPDHLKSVLVDDWEFVTKSLKLVPLPSSTPVNTILNDYLASEKPRRIPSSVESDILEEIVAGVREYFDAAVGKVLLYKFEREQFRELSRLWGEHDENENNATLTKPDKKADTKMKLYTGPGDVYGAEHLLRLFVALPGLASQTRMDLQATNRLREELMKLVAWFGKKSSKYLKDDYQEASVDYVNRASKE